MRYHFFQSTSANLGKCIFYEAGIVHLDRGIDYFLSFFFGTKQCKVFLNRYSMQKPKMGGELEFFFLQSGFLGPLKQVKRVKNGKFLKWYITYFYSGEHESELKFVKKLTFSQILMVKDHAK